MADLTEEINEPQTQTPEDYDAEYDRLFNEANGITEDKEVNTEDPETNVDTSEPKIPPSAEDETEINTGEEKDIQETQETQKSEVSEEQIDNDKDLSEQQKEEIKAFMKIKARGAELELTKEEAERLASMGIDYTEKTQELAKWRNKIELTKDIPDNDLNALKALKDGNKDALIQLAKEYNIDLYDLDADKEKLDVPDYTQNINQPNEELRQVESTIMADEETLPKVKQVLNSVPESFKEQMAQNPKLLAGLYGDIKSGAIDNVLGDALKSYYISGGDFLEHYQRVFQSVHSKQQNTQQQIEQFKKVVPPTIKQEPAKKDYLKDAEEIWNMPQTDFAKLKARVMAKGIQ